MAQSSHSYYGEAVHTGSPDGCGRSNVVTRGEQPAPARGFVDGLPDGPIEQSAADENASPAEHMGEGEAEDVVGSRPSQNRQSEWPAKLYARSLPPTTTVGSTTFPQNATAVRPRIAPSAAFATQWGGHACQWGRAALQTRSQSNHRVCDAPAEVHAAMI